MMAEMKTSFEKYQFFADLIARFNRFWQERQFEELGELLDNDVVFNTPGFQMSIGGKTECLKTFAQFLKNANVLFFQADEPQVHVKNDTAVITYAFNISYMIRDKLFSETGTDILVWKKKPTGKWQIIWRALSDV